MGWSCAPARDEHARAVAHEGGDDELAGARRASGQGRRIGHRASLQDRAR
jgi:hypothetical protein